MTDETSGAVLRHRLRRSKARAAGPTRPAFETLSAVFRQAGLQGDDMDAIAQAILVRRARDALELAVILEVAGDRIRPDSVSLSQAREAVMEASAWLREAFDPGGGALRTVRAAHELRLVECGHIEELKARSAAQAHLFDLEQTALAAI